MNLDRTRGRAPHWVGLLLCAATAHSWAQTPVQSGPEVPAPTIRVTTHVVLVDAVVTDKQGKPVTGLRPEDFVLEENGKAQKISIFVKAGENPIAPRPPLPRGIYS